MGIKPGIKKGWKSENPWGKKTHRFPKIGNSKTSSGFIPEKPNPWEFSGVFPLDQGFVHGIPLGNESLGLSWAGISRFPGFSCGIGNSTIAF